MRPYRGMTKDGEWVYGWYTKRCQGETVIDGLVQKVFKDAILEEGRFFSIEVLPETVGQQVGLKDKNGQEIYEHDEITVPTDGLVPLVMVVIWYRDGWRPTVWPCDHCGKFTCDKKRRAPYIFNKKDWHHCEITGNIHEPELLNKETT